MPADPTITETRMSFPTPHARLAPLALGVALALAGCGDDDSDYDFDASRTELEAGAAAVAAPQASFDPALGLIPFPNDLLFIDGETGQPSPDGTLSAPVDDADLNGDGIVEEGEGPSPSDPVLALNQLDGFSTVAPITIGTSSPIDADSLVVGETLRVFQVGENPASPLAAGEIVRELGPQELFPAVTESGIALLPTVPLAPATRHLVVVTRGVTGTNGEPLGPTLQYGLTLGTTPLADAAAGLEPLRQLTQAQLGAFEAFEAGDGDDGDTDATRADVAISFTFRTQSIREALQAARDAVVPRRLVLAPTGQTTAAFGAPGTADIWVGSLQLPYYLTAATPGDTASAVAAINSTWNNAAGDPVNPTDFAAVESTTVTVPVIATVPNATAPGGATPPEGGGGWPVTIFQHGITGNRTQMLALADAMAAAGHVLIAIDQPVHGVVTNPDEPGVLDALVAANEQFGATERHFAIDLVDDATLAPGPDGSVDPSGTHFINLANLGNTRDNLRQAAADLLTLSASLGDVQVPQPDGGTVPGLPLNVGTKSFVGHSLGGIVGTTMLSYDDSFAAGSVVFPGGGIAQLVANSERLGPSIVAGLAAANGVDVEDEAALAEFRAGDLQRFLVAAQTVIDSGDPINHAPVLAAEGGTPILLMEMDGDEVVPNEVATAPLSGTRPLARVLGLDRTATDTSGDAYVRFSEGDHASILSPEASAAATAVIQGQLAAYAATAGTQLPIVDDSVIVPVDEDGGQ